MWVKSDSTFTGGAIDLKGETEVLNTAQASNSSEQMESHAPFQSVSLPHFNQILSISQVLWGNRINLMFSQHSKKIEKVFFFHI